MLLPSKHPQTPALLVGLVSCVTGSCLLTGAWIQDMKRDQKASRADLFTPARTLCHRRASIIQKHIVRDSLQPRCENIGQLPPQLDLSYAVSRDPPAVCQEHLLFPCLEVSVVYPNCRSGEIVLFASRGRFSSTHRLHCEKVYIFERYVDVFA
jgi:hypothetical protein